MRITMVTEGTYPHAYGGVSVWCDQLLRGMPEHEFAEPSGWPGNRPRT
jgi:hypothetical protein